MNRSQSGVSETLHTVGNTCMELACVFCLCQLRNHRTTLCVCVRMCVCPTLQLHGVTQTNKELPQMPCFCPPSHPLHPPSFNHYPACMAFQLTGMTRRLLLCSQRCILALFSCTHACKHTHTHAHFPLFFGHGGPLPVSSDEAKQSIFIH